MAGRRGAVMIVGEWDLIHYATTFRTVWFGGRYGGGKTSLAVWLALGLVEQRYASTIISNLPLALDGEQIIGREEARSASDAVLILDEGWQELEVGSSNRSIKEWLAFLRKQNQIVLLPSVLPLARQVSVFTVERRFNGYPFGLPIWVYRWRLNTGAITRRSSELGWLWWVRPSDVFGVYDHEYRPDGKRWFRYDFDFDSDSDESDQSAVENTAE